MIAMKLVMATPWGPLKCLLLLQLLFLMTSNCLASPQEPLNATGSSSVLLINQPAHSTSGQQLHRFAYDLGPLGKSRRKSLPSSSGQERPMNETNSQQQVAASRHQSLAPTTVTILNPTQFDDDDQDDYSQEHDNQFNEESLLQTHKSRLAKQQQQQQQRESKVRVNAKFLFAKPHKESRKSIRVSSSSSAPSTHQQIHEQHLSMAPIVISNDVRVQSPLIMVSNDSSSGLSGLAEPVKTLSEKVELAASGPSGAVFLRSGDDDDDDHHHHSQTFQFVNELASITAEQDTNEEDENKRYSIVPDKQTSGGQGASISWVPYQPEEPLTSFHKDPEDLASSSSSSLVLEKHLLHTKQNQSTLERKFGHHNHNHNQQQQQQPAAPLVESSASSGIRVTIGKTSRPLVMNSRGLIVAAKGNQQQPTKKHNQTNLISMPHTKPIKKPIVLKPTTSSSSPLNLKAQSFNPAKLFATSQKNHQLEPLDEAKANKPNELPFKVSQFPSSTLIIKRPHHQSAQSNHWNNNKIHHERPSATNLSTNLISLSDSSQVYHNDHNEDDHYQNSHHSEAVFPNTTQVASGGHKLIRIKPHKRPPAGQATSSTSFPLATSSTLTSTTASSSSSTTTTTLNPLADLPDEAEQTNNNSSSWFFTHNPPYKQNLPADGPLTTQPMASITPPPPITISSSGSSAPIIVFKEKNNSSSLIALRPNNNNNNNNNHRFQLVDAGGDRRRRPINAQQGSKFSPPRANNSTSNATQITYAPPYETTLLPSESTISALVHSSSSSSSSSQPSNQPLTTTTTTTTLTPLNTQQHSFPSKSANKIKNKLSSMLMGKIKLKAQQQQQQQQQQSSSTSGQQQNTTTTPMTPAASTNVMVAASTEAPAPLLSTTVANNVASLLAQKLNSLVIRPGHHSGASSLFGFRVGPSASNSHGNQINQHQSAASKFKLKVNPFANSLGSHHAGSIINRRTTGVGSLLVSGLIYGLSVLPALMALTGVNPLASSSSSSSSSSSTGDDSSGGAGDSALAATSSSSSSSSINQNVRAGERAKGRTKQRRQPTVHAHSAAASEPIFPAYLVPLLSAAASAAAASSNNNNNNNNEQPPEVDPPASFGAQLPPEPQSTALRSLYAPPPTVIDSNSLLTSEGLGSLLDDQQQMTAPLKSHQQQLEEQSWQPASSNQHSNFRHSSQHDASWPSGQPVDQPAYQSLYHEGPPPPPAVAPNGPRKYRDLSSFQAHQLGQHQNEQNYQQEQEDWQQRNNRHQYYYANSKPVEEKSSLLQSAPTSFDDRISFGGSNHQPIQSSRNQANSNQFVPIVSPATATTTTTGAHHTQQPNQGSMSPLAPAAMITTTMAPSFVVRTEQQQQQQQQANGKHNLLNNQQAASMNQMAPPNQYNSQRNDLNSNGNGNSNNINSNLNSNNQRIPMDPIELYPMNNNNNNNYQSYNQAHGHLQTAPIVVGSTLQVARGEQQQQQRSQLSSLPGNQNDHHLNPQELAILGPLNPMDEEQIAKALDLNGNRQRRTILSNSPSAWSSSSSSSQLSGQNGSGQVSARQWQQQQQQPRFNNNESNNNLVTPQAGWPSSSWSPEQRPSSTPGDSSSVRKLSSPQQQLHNFSPSSGGEWRALGPPSNLSPKTLVNEPPSSSSSSSSRDYFASLQHQVGARRQSTSGEHQSASDHLPKHLHQPTMGSQHKQAQQVHAVKMRTKNNKSKRRHFKLTSTKGNKIDPTSTSTSTTTSSTTSTTRRPSFLNDDNDGESELLLAHSMAMGSRVLNEPLVGHHH